MLKLIQEGDRTLVDVKSVQSLSGIREEFMSLDDYPDPMLVVDISGALQYVNKMTYTEFGFEEGRLLGQHVSVICPAIRSTAGEADLLTDYRTIQKGIRTDGNLLKNNMRDVVCYTSKGLLKAFNAEFSSRTYLGMELYLIRLWRISDGASIHQSSSGPSSSRVRKTALQMQREVIVSLVVPAIVISEDGAIQEMNGTCCEMFEYSISELLGRNVNMLIPPGTQSFLCASV
jgi:PAS domain-containing protein